MSTAQDEQSPPTPWRHRRRASTYNERAYLQRFESSPKQRKRAFSFHEATILGRSGSKMSSTNSPNLEDNQQTEKPDKKENLPLPPPCTCPYFGESSKKPLPMPSSEVVIISSDSSKPMGKKLNMGLLSKSPKSDSTRSYEGSNSVVTWSGSRRGSSIGKRLFERSKVVPQGIQFN